MNKRDLKSIEQELRDLRTAIEHLRDKAKQEEKMRQGRNSLLCRIMSYLLGSKRIIGYENPSVSDLADLPASLTVEGISSSLEARLQEILRDKEKHKQLLMRVTTTFGLYEAQLQSLICRDWWVLLVLEFLYGGMAVGLIIGLLNTSFASLTGKNSVLVSILRILLFMGCFFLANLFEILIIDREQKMRCIVRRGLQTLLYQKLLKSDIFLLENADNNLIYRLLYAKFDDFTSYHQSWAAIVPTSMIILCLFYEVYSKQTIESINILMLVLCRILINCFQERARNSLWFKYKNVTFDQRKILFELITNYRSSTFKNLKLRYANMIQKVRDKKLNLLSKLHVHSVLEKIPGEVFLFLALIYGIMKKHGFLQDTSSKDHKFFNEFYYIRTYYGTLFVYICLEQTLDRIRGIYLNYLHYKSSIHSYNSFFDNDFVFGEISTGNQKIAKGEFLFENYDIYQRDNTTIQNTLDYILDKNNESEDRDCMQATIQKEQEPVNQSQTPNLSRTLTQFRIDPNKQNGKCSTSPYNLICSSFSAHIKPGQKVCIFENSNKAIIHGFVATLLGQNYINEGTVAIHGSISYFNPKKMHILVGKSIRDNILFGQDFVQDRYDEILRTFGVQFGNYAGLDFHQVAENAVNIRTEDLKTLLFARFLYQESDIYIIEEYFTDLNLSIMMAQVRNIFKNLLQGKTVVFCSNNIEMIRLSDIVITFESEKEHHVVSAIEFLRGVEVLRRTGTLGPTSMFEKQRSIRRVEVVRNKLKNSIFIANVSFDEELQIHKKLELQRVEIEQMKQKKTQIFDLLTYGMYLVHIKREQGKFLDEDEALSKLGTRKVLKELFTQKQFVLRALMVGLLQVLSISAQFLAEFWIIRINLSGSLNVDNVNIALEAPFFGGFLLISYLLDGLRNYLIIRFSAATIRTINQQILDSIFDCNIKNILNKKSHRILDNINKDLISLEVRMPDLIREVISRTSQILINGAVLVYCYSLMPLLLYLAVGYFYYRALCTILKAYVKVSLINNNIEHKIDDLNFQLLSLIGGYRIAGRLEKLQTKLNNVCNNSTKASLAKERGFKIAIRCLSAVCATLMLTSFLVVMMLCYRDISNWLDIKKAPMFWSRICIFRMMLSFLTIPKYLFEIIDLRFSSMRISEFLNKQRQESPHLKEKDFRSTKLDLKAPIILKNVSFTRGVQPILKRISFKIPINSRVALLSIEGGGRSQIFDLMTRIYDRDSREKSNIWLFGEKIESINENNLKNMIFVIERNPVLFEGKMHENLDPYKTSSKQQLCQILKVMGLGNVLYQMSQNSPANTVRDFTVKIEVEPKSSRGNEADRDGENEDSGSHSHLEEELEDLPEEEAVRQQESDMKFHGLQLNTRTGVEKFCDHESASKFNPKQSPLEKEYHSKLSKSFRGRGSSNLDCSPINIIKRPAFSEVIRLIDSVPTPQHRQSEGRKSLLQDPALEDLKHEHDEALSNNLMTPRVNTPKHDESQSSVKTVKGFRKTSEDLIQGDLQAVFVNLIDQRKDHTDLKRKHEARDSFITPSIKITNNVKDIQVDSFKNYPSSNIDPNLSLRFESSDKKIITGVTSRLSKFSSINKLKRNIVESSPFALHTMLNTEEKLEIEEKAAQLLTQDQMNRFLEEKVSFQGKNLNPEMKKFALFCRVLVEKPNVLLTYEESLEFGRGIESNLKLLSENLPQTTIVCITKNALNILSYDKLVFLDAGKVLEKGNPKTLLQNDQSFLVKYLKEAERETLQYLREKQEELEEGLADQNLDPEKYASRTQSVLMNESVANKADFKLFTTVSRDVQLSNFCSAKNIRKSSFGRQSQGIQEESFRRLKTPTRKHSLDELIDRSSRSQGSPRTPDQKAGPATNQQVQADPAIGDDFARGTEEHPGEACSKQIQVPSFPTGSTSLFSRFSSTQQLALSDKPALLQVPGLGSSQFFARARSPPSLPLPDEPDSSGLQAIKVRSEPVVLESFFNKRKSQG